MPPCDTACCFCALFLACARPSDAASKGPDYAGGARSARREEITPTAASTWTFVDDEKPSQAVKIAAGGAPIQLTASDGSGLGIVSVTADAVIDAPLALTQLRLVFDNPRAQQIEGQFRITLPERASISRFAMLTNGQWQEGEVVERQAARRAYEDFLHRRQDPALLEQQAGNEFSARIFPIPPHAHKEIIIAYSEELLGNDYRIGLKGLPEVQAIDIRVNEGAKVSEPACEAVH